VNGYTVSAGPLHRSRLRPLDGAPWRARTRAPTACPPPPARCPLPAPARDAARHRAHPAPLRAA
jgi:hypothetical protein